MTHTLRQPTLQRSVLCALVLCSLTLLVEPVAAQHIATDGSVGPRGTLIGPNYVIPADLGQTRGSNLFHSFSTFSVLTGESANFTGPNSVQSIFSRVTGGSVSNINGLLTSTIPGVNLFLLNPAGVLFGPNASINIGGSFRVTTADYVRFADGYRFSATLGADGNFTSAPYVAFGFLGPTPAPIAFNGSTLEVQPGATLGVVGGDITLTGPTANGAPMLQAKSGQVHIVSVASAGEVPLVVTPGTPALPVNGFANLGTITLTNNASIAAPPTAGNVTPGGRILMRGGKLMLDQGSTIFASTGGNVDAPPVAMDIQMRGAVVLDNGSALSATNIDGTGNGGQVLLSASSVELKNNSSINTFYLGNGKGSDLVIDTGTLVLTKSQIEASSFGAVNSGNGGAITIHATENVQINPTSLIQSLNFQGTGSASPITITTPSLTIQGGDTALTGIRGITGGNGPASAVTLNVGTLELTGNNAVIDTRSRNLSVTGSQLPTFGGGPITIQGQGGTGTAADLVHISGTGSEGGLLTKTEGLGTGGAISITANHLIVDSGALISATTQSVGSAGPMVVNVGALDLQTGGRLESDTTNIGNGGTIVVQGTGGAGTVANAITIGGQGSSNSSGVFTTSTGAGNGGDIQMGAGTVTLTSQGTVSASSFGAGNAGGITMTAPGSFSSTGGIVTTTAQQGRGGDITITAGQMGLSGATISASSQGLGDAGNIKINSGLQFISTGSAVTTEAAEASGGNITLHSLDMIRLINSEISTSVKGGPKTAGGDINIDPNFVILQDSRIVAQAIQGQGGNINITAGTFLQDPNSIVDASSQLGVSGIVSIRSPVANLSGAIGPLSEKTVDAAALVRASCAARFQSGVRSSLVQRGRDTLPADPGTGLVASPLLAGGGLVAGALAELEQDPSRLLAERDRATGKESQLLIHIEGARVLEESAYCRS